jgi:hypothetical protein
MMIIAIKVVIIEVEARPIEVIIITNISNFI